MKQTSNEEPGPRKTTYVRLSVTDQCDLQCAYCRPHGRVVTHDYPPLSLSEIGILVNAFAKNGVTKIRLTGGEPLLREDIVDIVRCIRASGINTVGLTTNGRRLTELAHDLAAAGLQAVNISLDTLNPETFRRLTGRDSLDTVLRGIDVAVGCGFEKVRINTVVMRGINHHELPAIADLASKLPVEARFIELMPLGGSTDEWQAMYVSAEEIRRIIGVSEAIRDENSSSACLYSNSDGKGTVGIISPMSEPFCGRCNRIRVTSSGSLKPCLRLPFEEDIRSLLREPDFTVRLSKLIDRLSCHKLPETSSMVSAVLEESMSCVGG